MSFMSGDKVKVKPTKSINPLYHGCPGIVVGWLHGNLYKVDVLGTQLVLKEDELEAT